MVRQLGKIQARHPQVNDSMRSCTALKGDRMWRSPLMSGRLRRSLGAFLSERIPPFEALSERCYDQNE